MQLRSAVVAFVLALGLAMPAIADAHRLIPDKPFSKMTLREIEQHQVKALRHADGAVTVLHRRQVYLEERFLILDERESLELDFHEAYARFLRRELRETRERLAHGVTLSSAGGVPAWRVRAFLCIHSFEGSWTDSGDPYWGGLQMDRGFMATYGSDMIRRYNGYANVWPASIQILVADRAYRTGRGFTPWPNTARYCHLL